MDGVFCYQINLIICLDILIMLVYLYFKLFKMIKNSKHDIKISSLEWEDKKIIWNNSIELQNSPTDLVRDLKIEDEESSKLSKKLKLISLIITIMASFGSVVYYIYSIVNGNTMILHPADTVIIQNSDLQLDQKIKSDKANEKLVIDKIIALQKTNRDFIPLDFFAGKIVSIDESNQEKSMWNNFSWKISLKINKTYDIINQSRINESIECELDSFNTRYFQKIKEFNAKNIEITWKIKLKEGDLVGFRNLKVKNSNVCELFQVNAINLQEFNWEVNKIKSDLSTENPNLSIVGWLENFGDISMSSFRFSSEELFGNGSSSSLYKDYPTILYIVPYFDNNPRLPMINISCKLWLEENRQLTAFFLQWNIDPFLSKNRIQIQIHPNKKYSLKTFLEVKPNNSSFSLRHDTFFNENCNIEKVNLLDLAQINIIDSYTFH